MAFWIDTHSHLSDEGFRADPEGYLARAKENNVGRITAISLSFEDLEWNLDLHEKYSYIDVAAGFFPGDVQNYNEDDWKKLYEALKDPRVIAVGEIGLDYYWDKTYMELQKECFARQIRMANELDKPILIHCRDAYEDTYKILKENPVKRGALMHCYSGSKEFARQLETLSTRMYFAFGGTLTYKNNVNGKETVRYLPDHEIMTETDSPYLTPQIFRGKRNESKNVRYVGEYMAELRETDIVSLQEVIMRNYEEFFGVKL